MAVADPPKEHPLVFFSPYGTTSASPHEFTLALGTLEQSLVDELPEYLIGDKAYDSDSLGEELTELGVEMIAPRRQNRKPENKTQNGKPSRHYKRR